MTVFTIAKEIDIHVFAKGLAVIDCQEKSAHYGFGIVGIYVKHRRIVHLCNIGTVQRRTRVGKISSEPYLVVYHYMHGTRIGEASQATHLHRFVDDTLP